MAPCPMPVEISRFGHASLDGKRVTGGFVSSLSRFIQGERIFGGQGRVLVACRQSLDGLGVECSVINSLPH